MSCVTILPTHAESEKPTRRPFVSRGKAEKAAPAVVSRQARITLLAFQAHDDRLAALAFLNAHSDVLGGRPIDAAGLNEAGLTAACDLLATARG